MAPQKNILEEITAEIPAPKKKLPGWVIIPVLLVIVGVAVVGSLLGKGSASKSVTTLQVIGVKSGDVREVYNANGTVESENTKTYYSPVTASIINNYAVVGQLVKEGDLLITFDTADLERDNQQARLSLQSSRNSSAAARTQNARTIDAANAASAELANKANQLAQQVDALAAQLNNAQSTYEANLASATAGNAQNQALRQQLQTQLSRVTSQMQAAENTLNTAILALNGRMAEAQVAYNIAPDQRTDVENALAQAFEDYNNSLASYNAFKNEADQLNGQLSAIIDGTADDAGYAALRPQYEAAYQQWQAAYEAAGGRTPETGMTSAELDNLNISDNLAELAALTPEELLQKAREGMKADMEGVIASVGVAQSNTVTQGMAVFSIASTKNVRVAIEVSPDDYDKLKIGNAVTVTVGRNQYRGQLTQVNKIATTNAKGVPVIGAQIRISNADENICIGASAKIVMTVAEAENVLVVPPEVVNASADGDFVYIIEDGIVKEQPVELGISSTTLVEIKSGLKKGDKVVNDFNVDIKPGMKAIAADKADSAEKD